MNGDNALIEHAWNIGVGTAIQRCVERAREHSTLEVPFDTPES